MGLGGAEKVSFWLTHALHTFVPLFDSFRVRTLCDIYIIVQATHTLISSPFPFSFAPPSPQSQTFGYQYPSMFYEVLLQEISTNAVMRSRI
jgi:hypothetical protein